MSDLFIKSFVNIMIQGGYLMSIRIIMKNNNKILKHFIDMPK